MKRTLISLLIVILTACASLDKNPLPTKPAVDSSPSALTQPPTESANSEVDVLSNLPDPTCEKGTTPADQEGPYYKPGSPERSSLLEDDLQGKKLILAGYVLSGGCFPVPHALLDFWQADSNGKYDNDGYTLRGHQFTDNKGRYYLETILPGLYPERPIEHIHVKVHIPNQDVFTTQLYFPSQPVDGLTISIQDQGDYSIGYFNFVVK